MEISEQIKPFLYLLGIKNLKVKFDCARRIIVTTYDQGGKSHRTQIAFEDIEAAFSDTEPGAIEAPIVEDLPGQGTVAGVIPSLEP